MTKKLYKFLNDMKSENGSHEWEKNKWYSVEGELEMCKNGFHASKHIQDALQYVQGDTLAVVEVDGEHIEGHTKECWGKMKVVETHDWSKIESMKLAIYSAKRSKEYYNGDEKIIEDCIDAAEKILNEYEEGREPSEKLLEAAESSAVSAKSAKSAESSAARSAVWAGVSAPAESAAVSAAWSAWGAAESAARSAKSAESAAARSAWSAARSAWSAAESAAVSAKSASWSAAESSAKQDIHEYCLKIVKED